MTLPPPSLDAPPIVWPPPIAVRPKPRIIWNGPASRRALLGVVIVGLMGDVALRSDPVGLAGSAFVLVTAFQTARSARLRSGGLGLLVLACAVAPWLVLRVSPWLVGLNLAGICSLFVLSVTGSQPLRALALGVGATPRATADVVRMSAPAGTATRLAGIARSLRLAIPIAATVVLLLASGDAFFASWLGLSAVGRRILDATAIVAIGVSWLTLIVTSRRDVSAVSMRTTPRHRTALDATVTLGGLAAVLLTYVASITTAAIAGPGYVERRSGLTYAAYARSGFFQLVAVVAVVVCVLLWFRSVIIGRSRLVFLGAAITLSTATTAVVAVLRLQTYRSVFGLTMLRFGTTVFAAWLAVVVLLVGATLVRPRLHRRLALAVIATAFIAVTYGNAANPEALIVHENITRIDWQSGATRSSSGAEFDAHYLLSLSDDATPALFDGLQFLPAAQAIAVRSSLCARPPSESSWSWNRSRSLAEHARHSHCSAR